MLPLSSSSSSSSTTSTTIITSTLEKTYDNVTGHKYINQYEMLNEIGRGVHGKVKLAQHVESHTLVAIKIIDKHKKKRHYSLLRASSSDQHPFHQDHDQSVRREMMILKKCHHPNIIQLLEIIDDPQSRKLYMVLEYTEGGAIAWRDDQDRPILSKKESRRMFKDIVNGLDYLHDRGIIHRDIKPANLLLTKDKVVKISDFGVSFDSSRDDPRGLLETVGTPAFFAPELCRASSIPPTHAMDVWSLGVTLYCFIFGLCPFMAPTEFELFELIPTVIVTFPTHQDDPALLELIHALLTKNPLDRITLKQVQVHPWVIVKDESSPPTPPPPIVELHQNASMSSIPSHRSSSRRSPSHRSSSPSPLSSSPSSTSSSSSVPSPQPQPKPTLAERVRTTMARWIRRKPSSSKTLAQQRNSTKKREFSHRLRPLSCFSDLSY